MTFKSNESKEIGWWFEALVWGSFSKIGSTFASLKASSLCKDIERLQMI